MMAQVVSSCFVKFGGLKSTGVYTPEYKHGSPENAPLEKEKRLQTTNFVGFHVSFRGRKDSHRILGEELTLPR